MTKKTSLPISAHFVGYFYAELFEKEQAIGGWYDQVTEGVANNTDELAKAHYRIKKLADHPEGKKYIDEVFEIFNLLLLGRYQEIEFCQECKPIFIVGMPRTGGTYITKQIYKALDIDYTKLSYSMGHDGYPCTKPMAFMREENCYSAMLMDIAGFIVMAKYQYTDGKNFDIIFPKKICNMVYNLGVFLTIFPRAHVIFTHRNYAGVYQSLVDKRGGLPESNKFELKMVIEQWAMELLVSKLFNPKKLENTDYYEVIAEYYRQYYIEVISSGLLNYSNLSWINFGEGMQQHIELLLQDLKEGFKAEKFIPSKPKPLGKDVAMKNKRIMKSLDLLFKKTGFEIK